MQSTNIEIADQSVWVHDSQAHGGMFHTYDQLALPGDHYGWHKVHVWLPPGYQGGTSRHPVLYANDGEQVFFGGGIGQNWWIQEIVQHSGVAGALPIVVGVQWRERSNEYLHKPIARLPFGPAELRHGGGLGPYSNYLADQIVPFIDANYRTIRDRQHRVVLGASHGGLAAFFTGVSHGEVFGHSIAMSPSFWAGTMKPLRQSELYRWTAGNLSKAETRPRIYIDWGLQRSGGHHNKHLEAWATSRGEDMVDILRRDHGYKDSVDLMVVPDLNGQHNEDSWRRRLPEALRFALGTRSWTEDTVGEVPAPEPEPTRADSGPTPAGTGEFVLSHAEANLGTSAQANLASRDMADPSGGDQGLSGLRTAAERAVARSQAELEQLDQQVATITEALPEVLRRMPRTESSDEPGFDKVVEGVASRFQGHFESQREVLDSFNIAFFGRTGAGKSTLLSTMGRLDGERVSQGESDWTVSVEPIEWHGCQLYDTPGINGWGRTRSRTALEETARRAVEVADVVLLCFDTQSQQATEFEKVAHWVRDYGKPVVAVLNVRNERWRLPDKSPTRARREQLSMPVRQHADHVSEELERIGLRGVPVVAVHSQRALAAQARTPFRGPNPDAVMRARERYGTARLLEYSNYEVLEALIAAAVTSGGAELRTAALREGVRQLLIELSGHLGGFHADSEPPMQALDRSIQASLEVLGYPDAGGAMRREGLWSPDFGCDALELYEGARGEPFTAPLEGSLERHVRHLLSSSLAAHRAAAMKRAELLIIEAFMKQERIEPERFAREVIREDEVNAAVSRVWRQAGEFLNREMELALAEGMTDVRFVQDRVRVRGDAGAGLRFGGEALHAAGVVGNAVVAGMVVAGLLNVWNPAGWMLLAGGVVAGVIGWFGRRAKRKAEEARVKARSEALADARRAVNTFFDEIEAQNVEKIMAQSWTQAGPTLRAMLEKGTRVRAALHEIASLGGTAAAAAASIEAAPGAEQIISDAVARVIDPARNAWRADRPFSAAAVLLGEGWIEQADDFDATFVPAEHPQRAMLLEKGVEDFEFTVSALEQMWPASAAEVSEWVCRLEDAAVRCPELEPIHQRAVEVLDGSPRIAIVGDYSSGKSSLIKRLLVEAGRPVPAGLTVRADPATQSVREYRLRRLVLMDTPGFQSGNLDHDRAALEAVADAALVIFVLHNNLLIGDTTVLDRVLKGGADSCGKQDRAMFLINRSDGLVSGDPADDPAGFLQARSRRESELESALRSLGVALPEGRVITIASDPFGLVGDDAGARRHDYDSGRDWDGIAALCAAVRDCEARLVLEGQPIGALEGAVSRLLAMATGLRDDSARLEGSTKERARVIAAMQAALRDADTVEQSLQMELRKIVDEHSRRILHSVLGATADELPAMAAQLEAWWDDQAFRDDIERFYARAKVQIDAWYSSHSSVIGREIRGAELRNVDLGLDFSFKSEHLRDQANAARKVNQPVKVAKQAAGILGERDVYYAVMKKFGVKFKPWGAVKGAQKVAKFGAVLAVAGVVLDAAEWTADHHNEQKREQARLDAIKFVDESAQLAVEQLLNGPDGDAGPTAYLRGLAEGLHRFAEDLDEQQRGESAVLLALSDRIEVINELMASANEVLQTNEREEFDAAA